MKIEHYLLVAMCVIVASCGAPVSEKHSPNIRKISDLDLAGSIPVVWTDPGTGCEYLMYHQSITPRMSGGSDGGYFQICR